MLGRVDRVTIFEMLKTSLNVHLMPFGTGESPKVFKQMGRARYKRVLARDRGRACALSPNPSRASWSLGPSPALHHLNL